MKGGRVVQWRENKWVRGMGKMRTQFERRDWMLCVNENPKEKKKRNMKKKNQLTGKIERKERIFLSERNEEKCELNLRNKITGYV